MRLLQLSGGKRRATKRSRPIRLFAIRYRLPAAPSDGDDGVTLHGQIVRLVYSAVGPSLTEALAEES